MTNYNWRNVLEKEGTIDPATIEIAKKAVDLEDKIEWWLKHLQGEEPNTVTHLGVQKIIKSYALKYKDLTGEYYRRGWKE